jgi:hypothetical protein
VKHVKHILISLPPYSKSPETAQKYLLEVKAALALPQTLLLAAGAAGAGAGAGVEACHLAKSESTPDDCLSHTTPGLLLISSTSVYASPPLGAGGVAAVTELSPVAAPGSREHAAAAR